MNVQLPYCFVTTDTDGKVGKLSFPPYVIYKSKFNTDLTDEQIITHLTATLNRFGNKVRDLSITREGTKIKVKCYSDYFSKRPGELWEMELEDADKHPIQW